MKSFAALLIVAAVAGGGAVLYRTGTATHGGGAIDSDLLYSVTRGKLTVTLTENGTLMAKNSEKITLRARRGGKITWLIEEGAEAKEGDELCKLDTTELLEQKQQLELDIVKTTADLKTARTELDIQRGDNVATIEKAQIALQKAENELEKFKEGDAPKQRREAEVAIKNAETERSRAEKKFASSQKLQASGFYTQEQVDQNRVDFERRDIELVGARKDLEMLEKYTLPMTLAERQNAVKDAQRDLENAQKRAESTLRQKEVAVEGAERRLESLNKKLEEVNQEIEFFTLKAPAPGIVIYADPTRPWYRDNIKLGGDVWGGLTVFTIPDLRVMQARVAIHEADINKLKEGQSATVTMDTYAGLVLTGKVTKVATIAGDTDRYRSDEVKEFNVDVTLDSTGGETLKPGISAKAEIFIDERPEVLYVPLQAVFLEEGKHYVHALRSGVPTRVEVQPDISNDAYIQINGGVSEGDQVLLYNPNLARHTQSAEEETATTPAGEASSP